NQSQLVQSWHETLPPQSEQERYYKPLAVPLDLHEKGVYLIEAVHGEHRAYTVLLITNLALVTKSAAGHMLVLAVDRASGRPLPNCDIKVSSGRKPLRAGRTDPSGIYSLKNEEMRDTLATAAAGADFAISDLQHYYFEDSENLKGYIYTDRPVY